MADVKSCDEEVDDILNLDPENDEGDEEFKRTLVGKSEKRLKELESQMRFRVNEGNGQSIYIIGVEDDGTPYGLSQAEFEGSLQTLEKICKRLDFSLRLMVKTSISRKTEKDQKYICKFLIRENNLVDYEEVKIATGGNVDSGKSTLIGTLISGILDDGSGLSRLYVMRNKHEIDSGMTSSISHQILGYSPEGSIVNHDPSIRNLTWNDLTSKSSKIIKFIDLCGHTKYSKTTIRGILSNHVDYAMITIGSNMGAKGTTREHISLCVALGIPVILLITKIDLGGKVPKVMKETINDVKTMISRMNKVVYRVKDKDGVITAAKSISSGKIFPMILLSTTKGDGLDLLHELLNMLRIRNIHDEESSVIHQIHETFKPKGVGLVIGGYLKTGTIKADHKYYLGPMSDGSYKEIKSRSLHVNKTIVPVAPAGRYVCVSVPKIDQSIVSRGMVLIEDKKLCIAVYEFYADVYVYRTHSTTIRLGYESVVHINSIRASVKLISIKDKRKINLKKSRENYPLDDNSEDLQTLRQGDRATVLLRFKKGPYFISKGERVFLAETKVKMSGIVSEILETKP